jgi:hypothetical protein
MAAHSLIEDTDDVHMSVRRSYLELQAEARDITLRWQRGSIVRANLRRAWSQPAYELLFNREGKIERWTGSRGEPWKA